MTQWLAGMQITADRLNDHTTEAETSSGLTAASGFSVASFDGRKVSGITTIRVQVQRSGTTLTADSAGNLADTLCATLPSGWRPPSSLVLVAPYDKGGVADGSVSVGFDGLCTLKTLSPTATIASGDNITFVAAWISENS